MNTLSNERKLGTSKFEWSTKKFLFIFFTFSFLKRLSEQYKIPVIKINDLINEAV